MTTQETVKVSAELILTTERGEVPAPAQIAQLITDQMWGELDEETGLTCAFVNVVAVAGDLEDSKMFVTVIEHRHGTSAYLNRTVEGADAVLSGWIRQWWDTEVKGRTIDDGDSRREARDLDTEYGDHTDTELIEIYFETVGTEDWTRDEAVIKS